MGSSPVFSTEEGFEGHVLAKYDVNGSPLLSGYFLGEEYVQGYAAALDVQYGDGRVVLLGFRPQWRAQPFGTFKVLFNAALYSNQVAALVPGNEGFWQAPEEAEEMFDVLTYQKGSTVLRMFETFIGEETFKDGVRKYLKK